MKKSKIFARKIVAVILSILMVASAFTGVLTVYAKSTDDNHDSKLAANFMAWAETTDNQTCEALLDWVDETLQAANISPIQFSGNYVVVNININGYIDSVDGVIDLARQVRELLDSYGGLIGGDVNNIKLNPLTDLSSITSGDGIVSKCNRSYRAVNDAKDIVMALAETIYYNSNDNTSSKRTNSNVIGQFIKGDLSLGSILSNVVDVYSLIGNAIGGMWSGYQSNLVYNILAQILLTKTSWFTEEEVSNYQAYLQDSTTGTKWNFDTVLFEKLSTELLSKISVTMTYALEKVVDEETGEVTYEPTDSSKTRYAKIKAWLSENGLAENDANIQTAVNALNKKNGTNWDPNLRYDMGDGMIYIFRYATSATTDDTLTIKTSDKLYDIADNALAIAWKTVLRPTLQTLRVNNSMDWYDDHGGNFDNNYYYWLCETGNVDTENWKNNYTTEKFKLYAKAVMGDYGCSTVEEFTAKVKKTFDYDRTVVDDPSYNWRDVDEADNYTTESGSKESILFGKLRYSPMADLIFDMQTGPINLYIMQTGFSNLETFMDEYIAAIGSEDRTYSNIAYAFNDALVAAAKDFFPDSDNIGLGDGKNTVTTNISRPTMATTDGDTDITTIASTLVSNVMKMFEYGCNVTDENLLNPFYHSQGITDKTTSSNLNESNFEEAMMPLAIACITIIAETRQIHITDWDYAKDAEGVGYVALREYLSYVLPDKDYTSLVTTENGKYEAAVDVNKDGKTDLYTDVILAMARDAVGYLLNSVVPCRDADGNVWDVYTSDPATDQTTLFDILNSIVCYYASTDTFTEPTWNSTASQTYGKGVAALLGAVDENGKCTVTMSNTLWTNIDNMANAIWPTLGTLQYGTSSKSGKFNSKELIYDRVIGSLLNIEDIQTTTGQRGITSLAMQFLTVFTAEPILNKGVDVLVYDDVVASLVNSIFGSRVSGQYYAKILPTTSDMTTNEAATPFDTLLQRKYIGIWKGDGDKENGIICNLLSNIYGFLGGYTEIHNTTMGDGCWQGAMFAVKGVSYFVDGFVPQLKDHQFNAASISVSDPSRSGVSAGTDMSAKVTLSNNATGLNRFYKDSNGNIVADDRYFVEVVSVLAEADGAAVSATLDNPAGKMIAPEDSLVLNYTGQNPSGNSLVTFTMTYNVYLGTQSNQKKTLLYSNQTATCYLNFSSDTDWAGSTLTNTDTSTKAKYPKNSDCYEFKDDELGTTAYSYKNLVITNNNPAAVNDFGITVSGLAGLYAAGDEEGETAYVAFDPSNGNIIKPDYYDYKIGDGDWVCGDEVTEYGVTMTKGYTYDEVAALIKDKDNATTRTHISLTLADDPDRAVYQTVETNSAGEYTKVTAVVDAVIDEAATAATPTHGINFVEIPYSASTEHVKWLKYDGTTSIEAAQYDMQVWGWDSDGEITFACDPESEEVTKVIIANTNGASTLQSVYEDYQAEMAPYQPTDYKDYNEKTSSSDTNDTLQNTFKEVVRNISAPVTLTNATQLISTYDTVATTSSTTSATGDQAFKPAKVSSTKDKMNVDFYNDGTYYYYDADHKFPVYSNEALEDSDVSNGKDATGQAVIKKNGVWYLANSIQYVYEWDTTTYDPYPYYAKTNVQATTDDEKAEPLYNQDQYRYYTTDGKQVGSTDNWTYKIAITKQIIKENDGNDYRGYYDKLQDALTYNVKIAKEHVDTSLITMITEDIIADRAGESSFNYDVATYEKKVQIAKEGEKLVTDTGKKDESGKEIYTTTASSVEIKEANRLYNKYKALVVSRGYEGDKLEAEIAHLTGNVGVSKLTATYDEDTKEAHVYIDGATSVDYGSVDANKELVNSGETVYTTKTWNNFIYNLAKAITVAQEAKEANITGIYTAKKDVVVSENALSVPEAVTTYTIAGTITEAIDATGTAGTFAIAGATVWADGVKVATADANGSFTAEIDLGTTDVTFKAQNAIERTVTFDGATSVEGAQVGIVAVDFNSDGKINATDVALGSKDANKDKFNTVTGIKNILRNGVDYNKTL